MLGFHVKLLLLPFVIVTMLIDKNEWKIRQFRKKLRATDGMQVLVFLAGGFIDRSQVVQLALEFIRTWKYWAIRRRSTSGFEF